MVDTWTESLYEFAEEEIDKMAEDPSYLSGYLTNVFIALYERDPESARWVAEEMIRRFVQFLIERRGLPENYAEPLTVYYTSYFYARLRDKYGIEVPYPASHLPAGMVVYTAVFKEPAKVKYIEDMWNVVRRDSKWYISMSPGMFASVLSIVTGMYMQGVRPEEAAAAVRASVSAEMRSKSIYFNLYYTARTLENYDVDLAQYFRDVARAVLKYR